MGLSSSKKTTTSNQTETTAPSAQYQPNIDSAAATLKPAYEQQQAVAQQYQPGLLAASNYYGDVMGGKYLDGNPHLQSVIDHSNSDITDQVNGQFMSRFGSGYHAKALAQQLGANEANLRYGDYATERGYQNAAPQGMLSTAIGATGLAGLPAQQYAQNTGGLLGKYLSGTSNGKSVEKSSPSLLQSIGQMAQIASMFV